MRNERNERHSPPTTYLGRCQDGRERHTWAAVYLRLGGREALDSRTWVGLGGRGICTNCGKAPKQQQTFFNRRPLSQLIGEGSA